GGPQPRVSSPAPVRSILITSAPRSARICPAHGPARMRASSRTRIPASGPGMEVSNPLMQAKTCDGRLVYVNAESRSIGERDVAARDPQRPAHDILGEIDIRQAHAPIDIRDRAGEVNRRGRADARLGDLGRDIDLQPELLAQSAGSDCLAKAAELDQLQRQPLR